MLRSRCSHHAAMMQTMRRATSSAPFSFFFFSVHCPRADKSEIRLLMLILMNDDAQDEPYDATAETLGTGVVADQSHAGVVMALMDRIGFQSKIQRRDCLSTNNHFAQPIAQLPLFFPATFLQNTPQIQTLFNLPAVHPQACCASPTISKHRLLNTILPIVHPTNTASKWPHQSPSRPQTFPPKNHFNLTMTSTTLSTP